MTVCEIVTDNMNQSSKDYLGTGIDPWGDTSVVWMIGLKSKVSPGAIPFVFVLKLTYHAHHYCVAPIIE